MSALRIVPLILLEAVEHRRGLMSACLAEICASDDPATAAALMVQGEALVAEIEEILELMDSLDCRTPAMVSHFARELFHAYPVFTHED